MFFGRDGQIERVCELLGSLALRPRGFLLLLGASGAGKSSLVRAGVVPRLRADHERRWLVLEPFKPGLDPFGALRGVLRASLSEMELVPREPRGDKGEATRLTHQLHSLSSAAQATMVLVIDQFEELLSDTSRTGREQSEGERFLAFLEELLQPQTAGVLVLATLRTDFLDPLQTRWPDLLGLTTPEPLFPIRPEDFGQLITGPAQRSGLTLQPGLMERLVAESGGRDALPLLAFTLEKLWRKRKERDAPAPGPNGERWDLTVDDYEAMGGVAGAVSHQAALCWDPVTSTSDDTAALRQAFLDHLLTLNDDGLAAKRPARLADLPPRSQQIIQRLVDDRLLVSDAGVVEIAHEALLRTWKPLVGWIEEGRRGLEQRRRVSRIRADLDLNQPLQTLMWALQGLQLALADNPQTATSAAEDLKAGLSEGKRDPQELPLVIRLLGLIGGGAGVATLSAFLEQQQLQKPMATDQAGPVLEALCQAAALLQDIHRANPPGEDDDNRWLLMPSATVHDNGRAVCTELVRIRLWATPRLEAPGAWFEPLGDGVALTMVGIPAGSFLMGSPPDEARIFNDEGPQHLVSLKGFWISQSAITHAQRCQVMGSNSCSGYSGDRADCGRRPVEKVDWRDARAFCRRLGERTGMIYTLPSEAQWEYACRAGTTTPFYCGSTLISSLANFNASNPYGGAPKGGYRAQTTPVNQFPVNPWGLHDMHGNVSEWCLDI